MHKYIIAFLFNIIGFSAFAQMGIRFGYSDVSHNNWDSRIMRTEDDPKEYAFNDYRVGLDYRKRIKASRIEFYPTLNYIKSSTEEYLFISDIERYQFSYSKLTLAINTHIYILDLEGECDCPTWGKEGGLIKKGFFLFASPELGLSHVKLKGIEGIVDTSHVSAIWGVSGGAGLDIGIAEKFTLTPKIRAGYYGNNSLPEVTGGHSSGAFYWGPEIRLGIEL